MNIESDPTFQKEFWIWFDKQPKAFKNKYWYASHDMACVYFYNVVYSKKDASVAQSEEALS